MKRLYEFMGGVSTGYVFLQEICSIANKGFLIIAPNMITENDEFV